MKRKKEILEEIPEKEPITGLTAAEVSERAADGRINSDSDVKTKTIPQIIKTNGLTFFNMMFIGLAVILVFFVEPNLSGFANFGFLGVVILNFVIGVIQEVKAKKTIDKLSLLSAPKVTALRDGEEKEITLQEIVLDDILVLKAGNQICSDAIIVDGSIEVNESLLTGEVDPIPKKGEDEILSGSFVVSGTAVAKVIRVGKENYASKISSSAKYIKETSSVILRSVSQFIKFMAIIILPLGLTLFSLKYWVYHGDLNDTVLTVAGTIIGMIPSGLMLLTTGVFCISVVRIGNHKALAKDLYCTEALARVDVLCLDKTGTITEGKMEVAGLVPNSIIDDEMIFILKNLVEATQDNNPTADAIREHTKDISVSEKAISAIPFSSARKWSAAQFESGFYVLGAAEFVLRRRSKKMDAILDYHSERGNRILVLAKCKNIVDNTLPYATHLLGYVLITDRIRKEAPETLRYFDEQGVTIKVISGDNPVTVKSIAKRAGVKDCDNFVDASTLIDDDMIKDAAEKYTVFGRVTPDQKLALVKALKSKGHSVAMTGDGVNDVLALKEADCSIAMAAGSDAAKNVSQIVLIDSNFASMPKIVAEGRRSINNLGRSSSLFLVKTIYNFLFALIFMVLSSDLPFKPQHLTLLSMVTIGIPSYFLALEPNKDRIQGNFLVTVIKNALPTAITITMAVVSVVLSARLLPSLTQDQISTICLIVTATIAFANLIKVSWPLNAWRVVLIVSMMLSFVMAFFMVFEGFSFPEFFGLSTDFSLDMIKIMLPVAVLSIPLFFGVSALSKKLSKYKLVDKGLEKLIPTENTNK